ncbi:MAG: 1-phosphofructokinase [Lachnospiraceae bacterium]|nr:1-phosphofructokinase [Lachnospiraceae bacterium]
MIYTVTFNPSLDYIVSVPNFKVGQTNRTQTEEMLAGGKGVNVSFVLNHLGIENTALGFVAGFTGKEIRRRIEEEGVRSDFITVKSGCSRINFKLKNYDGTEVNGQGPAILPEEVEQLLTKLDVLQRGDVLILAGSIPGSIPDSIYKTIMERLAQRDILISVDATRDLLLNVLENHPFLIKPNHHELGEIFGVSIAERSEVIPYAKRLQEMGARNVLVSMGGKGAVLVAEDGSEYEMPAPQGKLVNAVGAGDSMVAGFISGWLEKKDYAHAFKMGISAGSASAFSEGLATKEEVMNIYKTL